MPSVVLNLAGSEMMELPGELAATKSEAMHIALVCRWYPPHTGFGGMAMHVYYLARALVENGHRVTVVAARWTGKRINIEELWMGLERSPQ